MKKLLLPIATAIALIGCAAPKPKPNIVLNDIIPPKASRVSLTIISPQETSLPGQAMSMFTNYDYYLDCLEDHCKVGQMHMLQYITLYPPAGEHKLYAKLSSDNIANTITIMNTDTFNTDINTSIDTRQYVYHGFKFSMASLLAPFAAQKSTLSVIDEQTTIDKFQYLFSLNPLAGYGRKGTVCEK